MISMSVAVDEKMGIGKENDLLAHISPDLKYFKRITKGKVVIMGYNTYLSLPKRPLPDRHNVVVTRKDVEIEGVTFLHSIEEVLEWIKQRDSKEEIFIIGGASIYKQMLPYANRLYITHIFESFEADTFFPDITEDWKLVSAFGTKENITHEHKHMFTIYERR